jgi:soluble lytic murein transglycosylase-like protein
MRRYAGPAETGFSATDRKTMTAFAKLMAAALGLGGVMLLAVAAQAGDADGVPPPTATSLPSDSAAALPPGFAAAPATKNPRELVRMEATRAGLPPDIADAVAEVESGYHLDAIGAAGEIGLMQVMPGTARMLGFAGTMAELAAPEVNAHYGVTYLAQAWRLAGGDLCTAVMKYRAGHGETRFSNLSVNYCLAVRSKLFARGFPVTGTVPVASFGEPGPSFGEPGHSFCGRKCLAVSRTGGVNLAALNTRLAALVVQVRAGH